MSKQYIVTLDGKAITTQALVTQVTVPDDAQDVSVGLGLSESMLALTDQIYNDAPAS